MNRQRGFSLLEMVVALVISAIILVFVGMFIIAPVDAYAAQDRRVVLAANASTAWPRLREDIRQALPNSVRWRRNGNFVALEMLQTLGYARYAAAPSNSFDVAGTANGVFGSFVAGSTIPNVHLAVNNAGQEAYTQATSMTGAIDVVLVANGTAGEARVQLAAPPNINTNSPRNRIFLVTMPITYLCDEAQGTLTRYANYPIAAAQTARDTPVELAGAASAEVVARGLTACAFDTTLVPGLPQRVSLRLTATAQGESAVMLHAASVENLP